MIGKAKTASPPKRHWKEVEKARLLERIARFVIRSLRLSLWAACSIHVLPLAARWTYAADSASGRRAAPK